MGVETVFVLAGAQRRERPDRPRAIHIYKKKGVALPYVSTSLSDPFSCFQRQLIAGYLLLVRRRHVLPPPVDICQIFYASDLPKCPAQRSLNFDGTIHPQTHHLRGPASDWVALARSCALVDEHVDLARSALQKGL